jgi:hypothetical protein
MKPSAVAATLALGWVLAGLVGCDSLSDLLKGDPGGQACTTIGCSDSLNVTITPKGGEFPAGTHEVVITAEGSPVRTCTFTFPFAGPIESGVCSGGGPIFLTVAPLQTCTTSNNGSTASQSCVPVAGKFEERLSVPGLPSKVRITQRTLQGGGYFDREATPTYQDAFPNGKACGAVCKQAGVSWDF